MFSEETRVAFILFWGRLYFLGGAGWLIYRNRKIKLRTAQIFGISKTLLSIFRLLFFATITVLVYGSILISNWIKSSYPNNVELFLASSLVIVTILSFYAIFSPVYFMRILMHYGLISSKVNYITLKRLYIGD